MTQAANAKSAATPIRDELYFDPIKEHRGAYFVEYQPPVADATFATMNLVFIDAAENIAIVAAMNTELELWLQRYAVPLMITAWDAKENMLRPNGEDTPHLVGWLSPSSTKAVHSWQLDDLTAFLKSGPATPDWRTIYKNVPVKTDAEVKANAAKFAQERRKQSRYLKGILFRVFRESSG